MWNDPDSMNLLSRLIVVATLIFAFWLAGRQAVESWLPVRHVEVTGVGHEQTRSGLRAVVMKLSGGLFSVDLDQARQGFESLPWVRSASVRRIWPDTLAVALEEHVPSAAWNDLAVMDVYGDVFPVRPWKALPRIYAPEGMEKEVARRYGQFAEQLASGGWHVASLHVDARGDWQVTLADGTAVELGREKLADRLRRFVTFYPLALARLSSIRRVDMRYPNGFAAQGGKPVRKRT